MYNEAWVTFSVCQAILKMIKRKMLALEMIVLVGFPDPLAAFFIVLWCQRTWQCHLPVVGEWTVEVTLLLMFVLWLWCQDQPDELALARAGCPRRWPAGETLSDLMINRPVVQWAHLMDRNPKHSSLIRKQKAPPYCSKNPVYQRIAKSVCSFWFLARGSLEGALEKLVITL